MSRTRPTSAGLRRYFYRVLLVAIAAITVLTVYWWSSIDHYTVARRCFSHHPSQWAAPATGNHQRPSAVDMLPDIMVARRQPRPGRTVFFHETSCVAADGVARLNARQACAIESAALGSPDWDVFVLFASPSALGVNRTAELTPVWRALLTYGNVHLRNVNLWSYAEDTPLAGWMRAETLFRSRYLNSHASDLLRYLSLYKWGGTYLDLDVIMLRNLSTIPANYAGAESSTFVAAGVINLDHEGAGHRLAEMCLHEFQRSFDGSDWGNNGPGVITRALHSVCRTEYPPLMTRARCDGFEVFDVSRFYAVHWDSWRDFFEPTAAASVLERTAASYAVHVWNKHSAMERVRVSARPQGAYGQLAARHCPLVYAAAGEFF